MTERKLFYLAIAMFVGSSVVLAIAPEQRLFLAAVLCSGTTAFFRALWMQTRRKDRELGLLP